MRGHHAQLLPLQIQHLSQRAPQAFFVSGPLHGSRISQILAFSAHGAFEQLPRQMPHPAAGHHGPPKNGPRTALAAVLIGLGSAAPKVVEHIQTTHHARQAHIEQGIALAQVAQLMRHQAFQLLARERLQGPISNHNDPIIRLPARRECIDLLHARQYKHCGRRHIGGQALLLHDVEQLLLRKLALALKDRLGSYALRQLQPASAQLAGFQPPSAQNEKKHHRGVGGYERARQRETAQPIERPSQHRQSQCGINNHNDHHNQDGENPEQPARARPGTLLMLPN